MRTLAVDLGERRIGFAVCDEDEIIASPFKTVRVGSPAAVLPAVLAMVRETQAGRLVLGHPRNMSGKVGPKAREAEALAERLRGEGVEVFLWDERLTTAEAERSLKEANLSRKQRRERIDAVAAQRILHSFLEAHKKRD